MKIELITKNIQYTVKIDCTNTKCWYRNNQLHREDFSAIERANGDKVWYCNDQLHREDCPIVERSNGTKFWHLNGKKLNVTKDDQFTRLMKLKALL